MCQGMLGKGRYSAGHANKAGGGREGALLGSNEDRRVHIAQLKTHSKTNV